MPRNRQRKKQCIESRIIEPFADVKRPVARMARGSSSWDGGQSFGAMALRCFFPRPARAGTTRCGILLDEPVFKSVQVVIASSVRTRGRTVIAHRLQYVVVADPSIARLVFYQCSVESLELKTPIRVGRSGGSGMTSVARGRSARKGRTAACDRAPSLPMPDWTTLHEDDRVVTVLACHQVADSPRTKRDFACRATMLEAVRRDGVTFVSSRGGRSRPRDRRRLPLRTKL